jgi:hydrogenase nickel incorporation protein HypA/HybF
MHEARLCLSLLRLAEAALAREGGRQIVRVDLEVGEFSGVSPVALQTAFPICARGTAAEGAELRWQRSAGRELVLRSMEVV